MKTSACQHVPCNCLYASITQDIHDNGGNDTVCQHCGDRNVLWFTDDWFWNAVTSEDEFLEAYGVLCPMCFMRAAAAVGATAWRIIPEWSGRARGPAPQASEAGVKDGPIRALSSDGECVSPNESKDAHGVPAPSSEPPFQSHAQLRNTVVTGNGQEWKL